MDELLALQQAVREYCRHEYELEEMLRMHPGASEFDVEDKELQVSRARSRMLVLAGGDEVD